MMTPEIVTLAPKTLVGIKQQMSFAENTTQQLWQKFMPKRRLIKHAANNNLYSLQQYDGVLNYGNLNPNKAFTKWAAIEVTMANDIPEDMETLTLAGGLYAVFLYKGLPSNFKPVFEHIFGTWIPQSIYEVDDRPHFEILGEKYSNTSPDSEEEICIPVRLKQ